SVAEAGRGPHGLGQGQPGVLDLPGEAGPDHVRARRRPRAVGARGLRARRRGALCWLAPRVPLPRGGEGMKAADVRAKTVDELKAQLEELQKEAFNLRFQRASGQLENTARVRQVRRDIARIKTILGERERASA